MNKVNAGDVVSITLYAQVVSATTAAIGLSTIRLKDVETGDSYDVQGKKLIDRYVSADTFESSENITKTKIVDKLLSAGDKVFTVHWVKANGNGRTLRGRLLSDHMLGLGYIQVADLDITDEHNLRRVDCRTIDWIVLDGVQYTVK